MASNQLNKRRKGKEPVVDDDQETSYWSQLHIDMLMNIFALVSVLDRITNVAAVCRSWRSAASESIFTNTLDISQCRQDLDPNDPYGRDKLELAFVRGIDISGQKLTTLVFDPKFHVSDTHLMYASQRCKELKELVLPFQNKTTIRGLENALRFWTKLESFFIAFNGYLQPPLNIFKIVGKKCPNLTQLKFCCYHFELKNLASIQTCMPRLKVVCIRCAILTTDSLHSLLSMSMNLEEVYISILKIDWVKPIALSHHHLLPSHMDEDGPILKMDSRLRVYHVCYRHQCSSCIAATMGGPPLNITSHSSNS